VAVSAKKIPNEPNFARYLKKLSQLRVVARTHRRLSPFGSLRRPFVMRTACIRLAISLGAAAQPLPDTETGHAINEAKAHPLGGSRGTLRKENTERTQFCPLP
jgi:hypothetical protein